MAVSKTQIIDGIVVYMRNEMVPQIPDNMLRVLIGGLANNMKADPRIAERLIFSNPTVSFFIACDADGMYDLDAALNSAKTAIREYGNLIFTVPKIPFMTKSEQVLTFTATDIDQIRTYIEGGKT